MRVERKRSGILLGRPRLSSLGHQQWRGHQRSHYSNRASQQISHFGTPVTPLLGITWARDYHELYTSTNLLFLVNDRVREFTYCYDQRFCGFSVRKPLPRSPVLAFCRGEHAVTGLSDGCLKAAIEKESTASDSLSLFLRSNSR